MLEREGAKVVIADLPETDVTDEEAVRALVDSCDELHGVVNCAGIGGGARVIGFPLDRFRKIVEVNLIGTFNVLSAAAAKMAEGEPDEEGTRGVIVNTASNAAFDGQIGQAAYTASKAGVAGMTLPIARDLASKGIRVVTIAPGPSDTPMLGPMRDDIRESLDLADPVPQATRPGRGLRRARQAHRRERVPERRGDPPRRRLRMAPQIEGDRWLSTSRSSRTAASRSSPSTTRP